MPDANAFMPSWSTLLAIPVGQEIPDKSSVSEVRLFAPGWDGAKTRGLAPLVRMVKQTVLGLSLYGMADDEIAQGIAEAYPQMPPVRVSTEAQGRRVIIEAIEPT